jgi:hypothetical protein
MVIENMGIFLVVRSGMSDRSKAWPSRPAQPLPRNNLIIPIEEENPCEHRDKSARFWTLCRRGRHNDRWYNSIHSVEWFVDDRITRDRHCNNNHSSSPNRCSRCHLSTKRNTLVCATTAIAALDLLSWLKTWNHTVFSLHVAN